MALSQSAASSESDAAYERALRAYVSALEKLAAGNKSERIRQVYAADKALTLIRLANLAEKRGSSAEATRLTSDGVATCATAGLPYCTSAELRERVRELESAGAVPAAASAQPLLLDAAHLTAAPVLYSTQASLPAFPVPVLHWRRAGLMAGAAEAEEIKSKLIYPMLLESKKPVAAFIVEFLPNDTQQIGLTVLWTDGETSEAAIARSPQGRYAAGAYKVLFAKPTP
jgi:hypothetical protein